jgi:hypothetical protein
MQEQVAPYMAVGLSTVVHGIGSRRDIERNLQIVEDGIHAAVSIVGINMPVRLIALAEGALTGFTDEICAPKMEHPYDIAGGNSHIVD